LKKFPAFLKSLSQMTI